MKRSALVALVFTLLLTAVLAGCAGNQPPTLIAVTKDGTTFTSKKVTIEVKAEDKDLPAGKKLKYSWDFGDGKKQDKEDVAGNVKIEYTYAKQDDYTVRVVATDDKGAKSKKLSIKIKVQNAPPTAAATANPTEGPAPLKVEFDASASRDPDGQITKYEWDLDGDGRPDTDVTGPRASKTYDKPGAYSVKLMVTDDEGEKADTSLTIHVGPNKPPEDVEIVVIGLKDGRVPRREVSFQAKATDPEGRHLTYSWNFGDGTTSTDQNPTHKYRDGGDYTVSLAVTDDYNNPVLVVNSIHVNRPPEARVSILIVDEVSLTISFDASQSYDPDSLPGTTLTYRWNFGDREGGSSKNLKGTYSYTKPGDYVVTLTVKDEGESGQEEVTVSVHTPLERLLQDRINRGLIEATIKDIYIARQSRGSIILFADLHRTSLIQQRIARSLIELKDIISFIGVEGASSPLDLSFYGKLRSIKEVEEFLPDLAWGWLVSNCISASEYYALAIGSDSILKNVESKSTYEAVKNCRPNCYTKAEKCLATKPFESEECKRAYEACLEECYIKVTLNDRDEVISQSIVAILEQGKGAMQTGAMPTGIDHLSHDSITKQLRNARVSYYVLFPVGVEECSQKLDDIDRCVEESVKAEAGKSCESNCKTEAMRCGEMKSREECKKAYEACLKECVAKASEECIRKIPVQATCGEITFREEEYFAICKSISENRTPLGELLEWLLSFTKYPPDPNEYGCPSPKFKVKALDQINLALTLRYLAMGFNIDKIRQKFEQHARNVPGISFPEALASLRVTSTFSRDLRRSDGRIINEFYLVVDGYQGRRALIKLPDAYFTNQGFVRFPTDIRWDVSLNDRVEDLLMLPRNGPARADLFAALRTPGSAPAWAWQLSDGSDAYGHLVEGVIKSLTKEQYEQELAAWILKGLSDSLKAAILNELWSRAKLVALWKSRFPAALWLSVKQPDGRHLVLVAKDREGEVHVREFSADDVKALESLNLGNILGYEFLAQADIEKINIDKAVEKFVVPVLDMLRPRTPKDKIVLYNKDENASWEGYKLEVPEGQYPLLDIPEVPQLRALLLKFLAPTQPMFLVSTYSRFRNLDRVLSKEIEGPITVVTGLPSRWMKDYLEWGPIINELQAKAQKVRDFRIVDATRGKKEAVKKEIQMALREGRHLLVFGALASEGEGIEIGGEIFTRDELGKLFDPSLVQEGKMVALLSCFGFIYGISDAAIRQPAEGVGLAPSVQFKPTHIRGFLDGILSIYEQYGKATILDWVKQMTKASITGGGLLELLLLRMLPECDEEDEESPCAEKQER